MGPIDSLLVLKVLYLVAAANSAPILGRKLLADKFAFPIDGGMVLSDGQRLFGKSKTVRGALLALLATALIAPLAGLDFTAGAMIAAAAMMGDLFSSFVKRRLKIPSSGMALGLDQIPESLLPAIAASFFLPLTPWDIAAIAAVFFVGGLLFSRIFFALKIREQPY